MWPWYRHCVLLLSSWPRESELTGSPSALQLFGVCILGISHKSTCSSNSTLRAALIVFPVCYSLLLPLDVWVMNPHCVKPRLWILSPRSLSHLLVAQYLFTSDSPAYNMKLLLKKILNVLYLLSFKERLSLWSRHQALEISFGSTVCDQLSDATSRNLTNCDISSSYKSIS